MKVNVCGGSGSGSQECRRLEFGRIARFSAEFWQWKFDNFVDIQIYEFWFSIFRFIFIDWQFFLSINPWLQWNDHTQENMVSINYFLSSSNNDTFVMSKQKKRLLLRVMINDRYASLLVSSLNEFILNVDYNDMYFPFFCYCVMIYIPLEGWINSININTEIIGRATPSVYPTMKVWCIERTLINNNFS